MKAMTHLEAAQSAAKTAGSKATDNRTFPDGLTLDQIYCGDCLPWLRGLPDGCAQLVITSPPYFQQRDYMGEGLGHEADPDAYVAALLPIFHECARVVGAQGSVVFNLGDKYLNGSLALVPYRFALAACDAEKVRLVNAITWVKSNPTPRQFQRRLVSSTEPFFHFVKNNDYFYDIKAFMAGDSRPRKTANVTAGMGKHYYELIEASELPSEAKANARQALAAVIQEVRDGQTAGYRMKIHGIHSEPFGGQEGGRKMHLERDGFTIIRLMGGKFKRDVIETPVESVKGCRHPAIYPTAVVSEFLRLLTRAGDLVIDPFMGSGSTALACKQLDRRYLGCDINPAYCAEAQVRIAQSDDPDASLRLFADNSFSVVTA